MTAATNRADIVQATVLSKMWWAIMLRAVAIVGFGALALLWLGNSLPSLLLLFSIYALVDGLISMVGAVRGGGIGARSGLALAGATSVVASCAALWPELSWGGFAALIGIWAIVRGGLEFASALTLRKYMERDWSLALIGMLSVIFGAGVLLRTGLEPWTFVRLLGTYAFVTGLLLALLAVRFLKGLQP